MTEAIFPWYIAHQTIIIIVVGHALRAREFGPGTEFAIILAATLAGCAATYEIGRQIGWLRHLIGLRLARERATGPSRPAAEAPAG
jgi:membrane protein DedA with SNARE-associated domain